MPPAATRDVSSIIGAAAIVFVLGLPAAHVHPPLGGMAALLRQVTVLLSDAALLDERQAVSVRGVFSLSAPNARWKPDRFNVFGSSLAEVDRNRVRAAKDHDEIDWTRNV